MRRTIYMTWAIVVVMTIALKAGQIVRKTLQQKAGQSDIIATAEVRQVRAAGIRDTKFGFDRWVADCTLREVICGQESNRVLKVTFFIKPSSPITSLPKAESLEPGRAYVLFLRHDRDGLSLVAPWDSRLEVGSSYEEWDEDHRNDPELLKRSPSSIDGVPIVTLTHDALVQKVRAAWEKIVLDQPQQILKWWRTGVFSPCCGWSATQPRSFFKHAIRR